MHTSAYSINNNQPKATHLYRSFCPLTLSAGCAHNGRGKNFLMWINASNLIRGLVVTLDQLMLELGWRVEGERESEIVKGIEKQYGL